MAFKNITLIILFVGMLLLLFVFVNKTILDSQNSMTADTVEYNISRDIISISSGISTGISPLLFIIAIIMIIATILSLKLVFGKK